MFSSNQRAFNLFTALVSFVLIILSVLLVTIMIKSERTTVDSINDIAEGTELQAASDLARADAIQVFNYGIRYQIEIWLTNPDNFYLMTTDKLTWKDVVDDFARSNFGSKETGGSQFANRTAKHLTSLLSSAPQPLAAGYEITLKSDEEKLRTVLQKLFSKSIDEGNFFDVIKCENGNYNECLGTFYVNLNVAELNPEEYESLPQLEVKNNTTGRIIRNPILPRGNFRIYVPLRVFKALAGGFTIAHTDDAKGNRDYGLFSARIHNEIEEMKLGFCDRKVCMPRNNPYTGPEQDGFNGACTGSIQINISNAKVNLQSRGITSVESYNAGDQAETKLSLANIARDRINFIANQVGQRQLQNHEGFEIIGGENGELLNNVTITASSVASKKIIVGTSGGSPGSNPHQVIYSANNNLFGGSTCPFPDGKGLGVYFDSFGKLVTQYIVPECEKVSGTSSAYCTEVTETRSELRFRETNDQFKVSKNNQGIYRILLFDGQYTPFTIKFEQAVNSSNCAMAGPPMSTGQCNDAIVNQDWACESTYEPGAAPTGEGAGYACIVKREGANGTEQPAPTAGGQAGNGGNPQPEDNQSAPTGNQSEPPPNENQPEGGTPPEGEVPGTEPEPGA